MRAENFNIYSKYTLPSIACSGLSGGGLAAAAGCVRHDPSAVAGCVLRSQAAVTSPDTGTQMVLPLFHI